MLKKLKIRARLLAGFSIAILLSTLVLLVSIAGLKANWSRYEALIEGPVTIVEQIEEARIHMNTLARILRDLNLNTDQSTYASMEASLQERKQLLEQSLQNVQTLYTHEDGADTNLAQGVSEWLGMVDEVVGIIKGGDDARATRMIVNETTPILDALTNEAIQLTDNLTAQRDAERDNVGRNTMMTIFLIVALLIVAIVVLVILSIRITNSIVDPLHEMRDAMIAMSEGDLHKECLYQSPDEMGETIDALRTSQDILGAIIDELDRCTAQLASGDFNVHLRIDFPGETHRIAESFAGLVAELSSTLGTLRIAGDQISAGAIQVASGSQALAQGATEQASSVEELSATINDISGGAQRNAEIANKVRLLADDAGHAIAQSNEQMKEMLGAMDDISHSSSEIGKIIKTIEDIAFQTNILALNAAVEAARAGAAGKGFAVVADEVRNLASKSAEASKNTATLIEKSIHAVDRGTSLASNTATTLQTASEKAREAVSQIDQIAEAIHQEAASIEQTTVGIDQISAVVQTNSATSEQSAAASEELSSQAQMMHKMLDKFKLSENDGGTFGSALESEAPAAPYMEDGSFDKY